MMRFLLVIAVLSVIALAACSPKQEFNPEFNHEGKALEVKVIVHNSRRDLNIAYNDWVGREHALDLNTPQLGWATWTKTTCTIHIDGQLKRSNPREYIDTLGHEYAHCLYGRYHS